MSQTQYLKLLEREINKINRIIDYKIIHGEDYGREARDHKLMLRKVRYHTRSQRGVVSMFQRFFRVNSFQF
ncbi:MAG: hypothetical protein NTW98_02775 [Candidatus Nomurabacteria bacterium]|nr:hypothetical protein [Candidatus Nomurabacteria bacterium]